MSAGDLALKTEDDGQGGIAITVRDPAHPGISVRFEYHRGDGEGSLQLISAGVHSFPVTSDKGPGLDVRSFKRGYEWTRWERAARTTAVRSTVDVAFSVSGDRESRLMDVAEQYRLNVTRGLRDPVAQIARDMGVRPGTARIWVFRAREAGLLGPADGRGAGEAAPSRYETWAMGPARIEREAEPE